MRISDWSSYVCSADLAERRLLLRPGQQEVVGQALFVGVLRPHPGIGHGGQDDEAQIREDERAEATEQRERDPAAAPTIFICHAHGSGSLEAGGRGPTTAAGGRPAAETEPPAPAGPPPRPPGATKQATRGV